VSRRIIRVPWTVQNRLIDYYLLNAPARCSLIVDLRTDNSLGGYTTSIAEARCLPWNRRRKPVAQEGKP
jgi:hypothetical protein